MDDLVRTRAGDTVPAAPTSRKLTGHPLASRLWRPLRWAGACLLVGSLVACSVTPTPPPTPAPITVGLTTYKITMNAVSAPAGEVTFVVTNNASDIQHEFIVIQSDVKADKLTIGSDDRVDEESLTDIGEVAELDPGASGTFSAHLEAGTYVLICNIAGHYAGGMYLDFTVNP